MTGGALVLLPLGALGVGVVLELLLAGLLSARAKGWLAFAAGLAAFAGVAAAWPTILAGGVVDVSLGSWDGPLALAYHIDGLGFLFAMMGAGIGAAVLLYSIGYMAREKGATRFYALMLAFVAGLIHLVYTADLFMLYVGWEAVGLCSFLLVGFWYRNPDSAFGARKVLTMTHLAGYGLLAAVVLLYLRTGSTLWTDPRAQGALTGGIFLLALVAAVGKSVQFPLHTWIPDAMAAPTPVSALLHAACYVKAGVYLVARLHGFGPWPAEWGIGVSWLGALTILVGVLFAMAQHDLKRLLAFHTVSQIGYMMLGLGLGTPLGIAAGLLHCLNHGLFKGGLFLCAGAVQHATGTRDMDRMGGLGRRMPRTAALWLIVAGGIAGVPLLNGFVSKWLLYNAALEANRPLLALIPWVGSILTAFSFLKATSGVFLGPEGPDSAKAHEAPWTMTAGIAVLAAGCVFVGVAPQFAVKYLVNPLLPALGCAPLEGVGWFGLGVGQGSWYATAGLGLGLVATAIALIVYLIARPGRAALAADGAPTVFTGGEPLGPQGRLAASDFSLIVKQNLAPFYRAFDVDKLYLALWRALGRGASLLDVLARRVEAHGVAALLVVAAALAVGALVVPVAVANVPDAPAPAVWPLAAAVGVALAGLLLAAGAFPATRRLAPAFALAGLLAAGGALAQDGMLRAVLLEAGAVVALLVVWRRGSNAAGRAYLVAVVLSAVGTLGGAYAAEQGNAGLALALLLPGAAIKLGLVPLWCWLPTVAETTPAVVAGLVIGVVDVAVFAELLALRATAGWLFVPAGPWFALGLLSAAVGALLALAARDLKRLLAFSTVEDMGMLLVGLTLGGNFGLEGAMLGAAVHSLAKALLFACVAAPEAAGAAPGARGLASRHPVAAAGFLVGALAVLGVPPTLGYAGHWRIFSAAAAEPWLLAALCGCAMLCVATYARAVALFWWGGGDPPEGEAPVRLGAPVLLTIAIALLAVALLGAGFWPALVGGAA